jgi:hypothetical protein
MTESSFGPKIVWKCDRCGYTTETHSENEVAGVSCTPGKKLNPTLPPIENLCPYCAFRYFRELIPTMEKQ